MFYFWKEKTTETRDLQKKKVKDNDHTIHRKKKNRHEKKTNNNFENVKVCSVTVLSCVMCVSCVVQPQSSLRKTHKVPLKSDNEESHVTHLADKVSFVNGSNQANHSTNHERPWWCVIWCDVVLCGSVWLCVCFCFCFSLFLSEMLYISLYSKKRQILQCNWWIFSFFGKRQILRYYWWVN